MAAPCRQEHSGAHWALAALVVVALIAFLPPVFDAVVQSIAQARSDAKKLPELACRACGVVEEVQGVTIGGVKHDISTVSGDATAMLVALLGGKLGAGPVRIYEIAVRLQDGSIRILREATLPIWQPGDRVRVVMGRIRPAS